MSACSWLVLFATAAFASPSGAIRDVRVPPALLAKTSPPELSGIAWCAPLARYLVVSDDTGKRESGSWHVPWLFAMSQDGGLDSEPVPVGGIEKLNDAEAICPGPDGTFFVCTSHSESKKGKSGAARRMLLHVLLDGRRLRVQEKCNLTDATIVSDAGEMQADRLDPEHGLDIEGIAYRDASLFIGLKSPLAGGVAATLYEFHDPLPRMARGLSILKRYAELHLTVRGPSGEVPQGISDIAFLPDGSLIACANAPKGAASDGGGAVWRLRAGPQGFARPELLKRFPGLKPEGVAPSPDGRSLVVVFDRGNKTPQWTSIPLP